MGGLLTMTDKDCQEVLMLVTVVLGSLLVTLKDTDAAGKQMDDRVALIFVLYNIIIIT